MKLESFWLDTAPTFHGAEKGPVDGRADVAIIGGGFTGLSTALALAKRGATVVVLEAERLVGEASGRNGGQCNAGTLQDYRSLVGSFGVERARRYYQEFTAAVDSVERLASEEHIDCDFNRRGKLKLASKPAHFNKMVQTFEALQADGVDPNVELVPPDCMRDEVGSNDYHGGLLQTTSAQLHVGKFGSGLAEAVARRGVRLYASAPVTGLHRQSGGAWRITTPRGSVDAAQTLVATGGSGSGPFGWFRRRIIPVGSFIVVTEPLGAERLSRLLPNRRSYVTSNNIGNYFRVTEDNRLLFGGRARFAMSNVKSDRESGHILRDSLVRAFPEFADARIDYCWGGSVDMSADRMPHAGQHKGLYYSMGYSGHGVQMAVHMGQIMADIMDGNEHANPWGELKWPPILGHFGKPWFLPAIGAYYRLQDILR